MVICIYLDRMKTNKDGNILFEIEDKKYILVGATLFGFETNDEIVE